MKSRKLLKEKSIALLILGLGIVFLSAFGPALGLRSLISALFYRRLVGILLGTIIVVTALVVIRPLWLKIPLENSLIKSGVVISLGLSGIYCSFAVKAIFPSVGIIACFAFVVSSLLKEQEFSRSNSIRRQLLRTDIAILIYASLIAIIIVTVRTAFGFLDTIPSESLGEIIPKFWYTDDPVLAVYNKEHVRLAVLQFFLFTALAFFAGNAAVRFFSKFWSRLEGLHPATAIFAIVLFFGSISLPSFDIDAPHWTVWLGPALDALSGNWPYLHAQSGYGFLVSGVIGAWISLFAVSSLSLASLVFLATIIAGIAEYALLVTITQSKWAGLILTAILLHHFYLLDSAVALPNLGALRWQMMLATSLLFAWKTLSTAGRAALIYGALFALVFLWNPPNQIFMAAGLVMAHIYRIVVLKDNRARLPLIGMLLGVLVPLGLIILFSNGWPTDGLKGIIQRSFATSRLFYSGFGNAPQTIHWTYIVWVGIGLMSFFLAYRSIEQKSFRINVGYLFLLVCFMGVVPEVLYDLGRSGWSGWNAIAWVMFPAATILTKEMLPSLRENRRLAIGVFIIAAILFSQFNLVGQLSNSINNFVFRYEDSKFNWALECGRITRDGETCDWANQPGLPSALLASTRPVISLEGDDSITVLIDACKDGYPIVSPVDSFIYAYGDCRPPYKQNLAIVNLLDVEGLNRFIAAILESDIIFLDTRSSVPNINELMKYLNGELLEIGYVARPVNGTLIFRYELRKE